jgi:diguanylate cyclase (GGDEF)-like protein
MNFSIKKTFTAINALFAFFVLVLAFVSLVMYGEHNSQKQISLLQKHQKNIQSIKDIKEKDETLRLIQFESISVELSYNIRNYFETFNTFEPISFLSSSDLDKENFDIFKNMTLQFIANAKKYIKNQDSKQNKIQFDKNYNMLNSMIYDMLNERISAEHKQFATREKIIYLSLAIAIIFFFVIFKQLSFILRDIESLYGVTSKSNPYEIKTMEVEAIAAKFKLDTQKVSDNPAYIDTLTQLKNYKGVIHKFNTTKAIREHNSLNICIFDIDHYAMLKRKYKNDFIELIRKKIAFMISLYEQPIDIVGTFDESKFILVLGRSSKKEALGECEKVRQSVADTFFKVPNGEKISVTLSGGFITKPSNKSIEASIEHTKDILKKAQKKGTNHIAQLRDYAEKF